MSKTIYQPQGRILSCFQRARVRVAASVAILGLTIIAGARSSSPQAVSGVCYGPFRQGQQPGGPYPTRAQIEEDMALLGHIGSGIRTYGTEETLYYIPELCAGAPIPLDCYPGAWIDNAGTDDIQVEALIRIAVEKHDTTRGLIVGNEFVLREEQRGHDLQTAREKLIAYIAQIKAETDLPVTVAEPWHIWNYDSSADLASAVDFIMIHVHPYWESPNWQPNLSIDGAAQYVMDRYDQIRRKYPGKRVVIGETGWPTAGPAVGAAVPGEANQERFLREFTQAANERQIEYFFFEAFDEPWKDEGGAGAHWGLFNQDRELKPRLRRVAPGPGDYNGDGAADTAIFRPVSGFWAVRGTTRAYFGSFGDLPASGDYAGDGTTDIAVFRPGCGLWAVRDVTRVYFGAANDTLLPRDYNGDGTTDIAIFRPASGLWAVKGLTRTYFGYQDDLPVPGDYNEDGTADIAGFRPSSGLWAVRGVTRLYFGSGIDLPVPGDYDGSGKWRPAVFRPATGSWAVREVTRAYFGGAADQAVPADFSGDGTDDFGIFRDVSGLWAARGVTRFYFGVRDDVPVTR